MSFITSEEELAKALKQEEDTIEITGDLTKKIIKIKATGKIAWAIALAAIAIAIPIAIICISSTPATGPVGIASTLVALPVLAPAVATLGAGTAFSAVFIAISGKSIDTLK
jgi:hypothetical protein